MLKIVVPDSSFFDERTSEFIEVKGASLQMEHSLISISKWESKWHIPFLGTKLTMDQLTDYANCMLLNKNIDPLILKSLTVENYNTILEYIGNPMTATMFKKGAGIGRGGERMTSEYIYYLMAANQIPFECCEKWHINRLIVLLRICSIKSQPDKKMSRKEIMAQNRALNAQRRAKSGSKG